jgi:hypothetical protein
VIDLADNWLNLRRLGLTVFADNPRAIGLYESLGFQREGVMREFGFKPGEVSRCRGDGAASALIGTSPPGFGRSCWFVAGSGQWLRWKCCSPGCRPCHRPSLRAHQCLSLCCTHA